MKKVLSVIAVVTLIFAFTGCVLAASGDILYSEDFNAGQERIDESWMVAWGNVEVADNLYKIGINNATKDLPTEQGAATDLGEPKFKDFQIEFKFRVVEAHSDLALPRFAGISIRKRKAEDPYWVSGYIIRFIPEGLLQLLKLGGDSVSVQTGINFSKGDWHTWKIIAEGKRIRVYIDGEKFIEYTDNASTIWEEGYIGFATNCVDIEVDDLVITQR